MGQNCEDPMHEEFARCRALAERWCNTGEDDCRWYHGSWHLLNGLGIVSSSGVHREDILNLLKTAIGDNPAPRLLLSGSSDETLLRMVQEGCQGADPRITALDTCATPLAFMQAYADHAGLEIATIQSDILEFSTSDRFDVILTHAFMGNFDDAQRQRLVVKWKELLSEQGRIVTIQRIRPRQAPARVCFSQTQASDFVAAAIAAARGQGLSASNELELVEQAAAEFARRFVVHAVRSKDALEKLFLDAGLIFHSLGYHALAEKPELSGPSVPSGGEYAHIIAGKP
jgi:hypothetical protein